MALERAFIPYRGYWSTPFCKWQGLLAGEHSVKLGAQSAAALLAARSIDPASLDGLSLGITVLQRQSFYGAPWIAALLGAPGLTGPTISQVCATSARQLWTAAADVECGMKAAVLSVACDRTSNGPHVYFPNPGGPGGTGDAENVVWDNFGEDPNTKVGMLATAENVAREAGITRAQQDEMTLLRYAQYQDALANDRAFQKRYMLPVELRRGKKVDVVAEDEGIFATTADGLAALRPVVPDGTVTFGSQTHPADGNAGMIVATKDRAAAMSADRAVTIQLLAFGEARVKKAFMPMAPVPAARQALERAGLTVADCKAIKTHNPFAVNDVYLCRELDVAPDRANRYGSPLVFGHPQAPTGLRAIVELVEELVISGGGVGLFSGCAAGDTGVALVLKVS